MGYSHLGLILFSQFSAELRRVFDHTLQGQEATKRLFSLSQGSQSVADYS